MSATVLLYSKSDKLVKLLVLHILVNQTKFHTRELPRTLRLVYLVAIIGEYVTVVFVAVTVLRQLKPSQNTGFFSGRLFVKMNHDKVGKSKPQK